MWTAHLGACWAHAPYRTHFFLFAHILPQVPVLEVHTPPQWVHASPMGNPGSATATCHDSQKLNNCIWNTTAVIRDKILSETKSSLRKKFLEKNSQIFSRTEFSFGLNFVSDFQCIFELSCTNRCLSSLSGYIPQ